MSQSNRVRGIKLPRIVEVLEYLDHTNSKRVRLACGHIVTCHPGALNRARCRACERAAKSEPHPKDSPQ